MGSVFFDLDSPITCLFLSGKHIKSHFFFLCLDDLNDPLILFPSPSTVFFKRKGNDLFQTEAQRKPRTCMNSYQKPEVEQGTELSVQSVLFWEWGMGDALYLALFNAALCGVLSGALKREHERHSKGQHV